MFAQRRRAARVLAVDRPSQPDYALTVDGDFFELAAGKPLEITVNVNRIKVTAAKWNHGRRAARA